MLKQKLQRARGREKRGRGKNREEEGEERASKRLKVNDQKWQGVWLGSR